ncbi:cell division protein CrgA [Leucobacter sp. 1207-22]|uniref:cell division protein CrgA n=1 Tax=Leucobacter sp. 1207-22 TaxID=2604456 RepID=UPI004062A04E
MVASGKQVQKNGKAEVASAEARRAARSEAPNPVWFKPVMFGFMLIGLLWIVTFYITSSTIALPIPSLGNGNIFVGFGFILIGFLMTPWWK